MNLQENLKMVGELTIQVFNENGDLKSATKVPNLVVTNGKNYIASRMVGTASTVMSHMAIGTGTASPIAGDVNLGTEAYRASITFTASTNTVTATATFSVSRIPPSKIQPRVTTTATITANTTLLNILGPFHGT